MKKLMLLLTAGMLAAAGFVLAPASAEPAALTTPIGSAGSDGDQALILDGNADNPDPADGYISVSEDGTVSCDADGGPYDAEGNNVNDDEDDDNDWTASGECDPSDSVPPLPVPAP